MDYYLLPCTHSTERKKKKIMGVMKNTAEEMERLPEHKRRDDEQLKRKRKKSTFGKKGSHGDASVARRGLSTSFTSA